MAKRAPRAESFTLTPIENASYEKVFEYSRSGRWHGAAAPARRGAAVRGHIKLTRDRREIVSEISSQPMAD